MLNDKTYLTSINQSHHIDHNGDQYEEAGHDGEGEEAAEAGAGQQRAGRGGEAEHVAQGAGHRHQPGHRQGGHLATVDSSSTTGKDPGWYWYW